MSHGADTQSTGHALNRHLFIVDNYHLLSLDPPVWLGCWCGRVRGKGLLVCDDCDDK